MKAIKTIIFWLATVSLLLAIAFIALPMLGGLEYRAIISGSMEPDIPVGSLVIIAKIKDAKVEIGDVITFAAAGDKTVTHKVVGYDLSKDAVITHGIANADGVNEITPYKNIIGKVVFTIPWIGKAFLFVSSSRGKVITITAIAALYILSVIFENLGPQKEGKEDTTDSDKGNSQAADADNERGAAKKEKKPEQPGSDDNAPKLGSWLDDL